MSDEAKVMGDVKVGDTFERVEEPGVAWVVALLAPGLVRTEGGTVALSVARLESGPEWAFETHDSLTSGKVWRRVRMGVSAFFATRLDKPASGSAPAACSGSGVASCL